MAAGSLPIPEWQPCDPAPLYSHRLQAGAFRGWLNHPTSGTRPFVPQFFGGGPYIYRVAALKGPGRQGQDQRNTMQAHSKVIENFVQSGAGGKGNYVVARERDHALYSTYHRQWQSAQPPVPLTVELESGSFLANGANMQWPMNRHQGIVLRTLEKSPSPFGVVPFDSITAAMTEGKVRDWRFAPFKIKELRREIDIVIPSSGEQWKEVVVRDKNGRESKRSVHTLGDSVLRVREDYFLSGVDDTGHGRGLYFLARLSTRSAPGSYEEALSLLKPRAVLEAEAKGSYVKRQGEWFALPTMLLTSQLMQDVERGYAVYKTGHILGRNGHHQLEEAVIYRNGPRKGEVYARGVIAHTRNEHRPLDLGIRWHRIIHNIQEAAYSLAGNFD